MTIVLALATSIVQHATGWVNSLLNVMNVRAKVREKKNVKNVMGQEG